MKLDNKGLTLVEIVVSVALISVVLIFLFTLLIQVNNENADNEVRSSYLVNQSAFIKQIEEDFIEYKLQSGTACTSTNINPTGTTETTSASLYLPRIYGTVSTNASTGNIKCLKFTFDSSSEYTYAYLFLYKRSETNPPAGEPAFKTILSYYRGDFKQSVELEDFDWSVNTLGATYNNGTYKVYSLPIIGPDYNDYSINLSYAS